MHTGPIPDSAGTFTKDRGASERFCRGCGVSRPHECDRWDSNCGAYTDYRYTCAICGAVHWIEGIDS